MATIRLGNRDGGITLNHEQERYVRDLLAETHRLTMRHLEDTVTRIRHQAAARWPVGTNPRQRRSKAQMDSGLRIVSDSQGPYLGGFVGNDASWVYYIRSNQIRGVSGGPVGPSDLSPPLDLDQAEQRAEDGLQLTRRVTGFLGKVERGPHAFTELIRKPFKAAEAGLVGRLSADLARAAGG